MRENRPYGSEGGASQTNGTSLPPIVGEPASGFEQTKVNVAIIAPRLSFFAFYRRFLLL